MAIPKDWTYTRSEQIKAIIKDKSDAMKSDDQLDLNIAASLQRTGYLLMANKYAFGAPVPSNPGLIVMSEDINLFSGITNGSDYLYHVKAAIDKSQPTRETKEIKKLIINGQEFGLMQVNSKSNAGSQIKQSYYSTIVKRHSIAFIFTYLTEQEFAELKGVADSFTMLK
ncbi:MAG: hypothetical protein H7096_06015 [Flavobacterium sp.]|nr:hypothetical protein [Pedobacter sp.]